MLSHKVGDLSVGPEVLLCVSVSEVGGYTEEEEKTR